MSKETNSFVMTLAVLGSLVFINIIGWGAFSRLDLTEDQRFTLSPSTRAMLGRLEDPVTIRAYFSEQMSPNFSNNRQYVRDILDEYYSASNGRVFYEFIDPVTQETAEDKEKKEDLKKDIFGRIVREKTSVERELEQLGIQPIQDRVIKGDSFEDRKVYMGLVVKQGEDTEVIPVVADPGTLEYDLTTMIRKLTRAATPKVRVISGFGGPTEAEGLQVLFAILKENYDVAALDLNEDPTIPDDVNAIVLVGPTQPLSEPAKQEIDRYVSSGGAAALFLDDNDIDLQQSMQPTPVDHGLKPVLATYGVTFSKEYVVDQQSLPISVNSGQSFGGIPIPQRISYPLIPAPEQLSPDNPITRGLGQVAFPFVQAVSVAEREGLETALLATSSKESFLLNELDTNPFNLRQLNREQVGEQGPHELLVSVRGPMPSHFGGAEATEKDDPAASGGDARLLVAGTSRFIQDDMMRSPMSQALALNLMDWLLLDEALLGMRTRGLTAAPFDESLDDAGRATIRYGNMLGLPLAFILFGLIRWRLRESRRTMVSF